MATSITLDGNKTSGNYLHAIQIGRTVLSRVGILLISIVGVLLCRYLLLVAFPSEVISVATMTPSVKASVSLDNTHTELSGGYVVFTGVIRNVSDKELKGLEFVTDFYGRDGVLLSSEVSLPRFSSIGPGEAVSVEAMTKSRDGISMIKAGLRSAGGARVGLEVARSR